MLQTIKKIILKNKGLLVSEFYKPQNISSVANHDVKIDLDKRVEEDIIDQLKIEFPDYGFNSEEFGLEHSGREFVWYIDPIDGTNNFILGIPYFGTSIALVQNGEPIFSMVLNPITNQLWWAEKGKGTFKQNLGTDMVNKLKVEDTHKEINKSVVSFVRGHQTFYDDQLKVEVDKVESKIRNELNPRRVLETWVPVLDWALLAEGKIDAVISIEDELQEKSAGILLAKEAGLEIINLKGEKANNKDNRIIVSTSALAKEIFEKLN